MHAVDESAGARVALLTFGSRTNANRAEPSYAFMNTVLRLKRTQRLCCDVYYFKAKRNDWYFSGSEGQPGLQHTQSMIDDIVRRYERTVFLGNSMGGYAALIFGLQAKASSVLAFSPQTRFDVEFGLQIGEQRWQSDFAEMRLEHDVQAMAVSQRLLQNTSTSVQLFWGALNAQDAAYCQELSDRPNVKVHAYPDSGHDLVHDLRATGELERLIHDSIGHNFDR